MVWEEGEFWAGRKKGTGQYGLVYKKLIYQDRSSVASGAKSRDSLVWRQAKEL